MGCDTCVFYPPSACDGKPCCFVITTEGSWDKPTKKYCEDCGAKMDGDSDALD